jgi:hypothetical protein
MMGSGLSLFIKDHTHTQTSRSVEPLCTLCTASPAVLSIWLLQKCFSHPSLVIYVFATPPIKLKLGYQICEGLLIANHLDESLWWANQKHWSISQIFSVGTHWCCAFHQPLQTIFLSQTHKFWLFFTQFYCAGSHILSTAGDVLSSKNQDPPEHHHPLEASYDSVVDERH